MDGGITNLLTRTLIRPPWYLPIRIYKVPWIGSRRLDRFLPCPERVSHTTSAATASAIPGQAADEAEERAIGGDNEIKK
jgi:hypothetical protein